MIGAEKGRPCDPLVKRQIRALVAPILTGDRDKRHLRLERLGYMIREDEAGVRYLATAPHGLRLITLR